MADIFQSFLKEVYKVISALENTNLQLRNEVSFLTASYSEQPSPAAIEEI
jgi:hypothetical protein